MSKGLIINPPFLEPHRPPIACAILAELLRLKNVDVQILDLNIELFHKLGRDEFYSFQVKHTTQESDATKLVIQNHLLEQCKNIDLTGFDWIVISCFSYWNISAAELICRWLKTQTSAKIVIGGAGIEVRDSGKLMYENGLVDYYIYGEAEHVIPALLDNNTQFPGINGIPPEQIDNIETLPLPNYGFFDLERYDWLLDAPDVFIYGSRGCVRKCTFCDVEHYWPKFKWRSGQSLANEMISNYEKYGIKNYFFSDSLVNGNLKEFKTMCEILANYKENLFRWASYAIVRPKSAHPASLFDLIGASGGKLWSIGIESGVDRIRAEMQKKFTNDDIDWHLEQSQRIGLQNNFLCIPTWPGETLEEHKEYLNMFSRWQNYAADGTIFGIVLSPSLEIIDNTRISRQEGSTFVFDEVMAHDLAPRIGRLLWRSDNIDQKEKFRRTLALYEAALKYKWPLTNCLQKLNELKSTVEVILKNQHNIRPVIVLNQLNKQNENSHNYNHNL